MLYWQRFLMQFFNKQCGKAFPSKKRRRSEQITDYFQALLKYFDTAQIDYYSGSVKGFQKLIFQATGNYIPLNKIEEYLFYKSGVPKPKLFYLSGCNGKAAEGQAAEEEKTAESD